MIPDALKRDVDIAFLALDIYREARGETLVVKIGVAYSIMERVKRPSWMGRDVLSVVSKKYQYSSMTNPGDPNLVTWPQSGEPAWQDCVEVAERVYLGQLANPVANAHGTADSYYDISIKAPSWADKETFICQLGKIRFYDSHKLATEARLAA